MTHAYTVTAFSENSPGILHRISTILTRRKLNIESLTVSETERKGISRFTIVIKTDAKMIEKVVKQISRIIEVSEAYASENEDLLFQEVAFFRVLTPSQKERAELEQHAERFDAPIVFAEQQSMVIQKAGTEDEINSLYVLLEPFGIKEFVRSGRIAILKHSRPKIEKFAVPEKEIEEDKAPF
jgi:acetolactate synthase I/III small subunit